MLASFKHIIPRRADLELSLLLFRMLVELDLFRMVFGIHLEDKVNLRIGQVQDLITERTLIQDLAHSPQAIRGRVVERNSFLLEIAPAPE